jgi:hypothetical protein
LAQILSEREFTLLFHEGKEANLHVMQVTDHILLLITFGRETQVGRVRLYTSRALEVLKPALESAENTNGEERFVNREMSSEIDAAIDGLFSAQGEA